MLSAEIVRFVGFIGQRILYRQVKDQVACQCFRIRCRDSCRRDRFLDLGLLRVAPGCIRVVGERFGYQGRRHHVHGTVYILRHVGRRRGNDDAGQEAAPADNDEFDIGGTDEFDDDGEADDFGEVDEYNGDDAGDDFGEVDEYNGDDAGDEFGETDEFGEQNGEFGETDEFGEQADEFGETGEGDEFDDAGDLADGYAAEATFSADGGTPSFNSFAMKLYVNGDYVPASGTLKISDMDGNEVASIDLSDSSAWGVRDAAAAYISVPGYDEANEISIFTGDTALYASQYRVAGDVTFAQNDGGEALPGTETAPVHVESEFYYMPAGISVSGDGFKANSSATVSIELPEDAAAANVYTSDDEVATVDGGYLEESGAVSMSLMESGDVTVVAEYLDAEGNVLGQDSVEITVF